MKGAIVCLTAVVVLLMAGCPSQMVAERGMATRGPAQIGLEFDGEGNIRKFDGATGGGTGSVVHITRKTWFENGQPKSDFLGSSDPTLVQNAYFLGVRNQSVQDTANYISGLNATTSAISSLASMVVDLRNQVKAASPTTGDGQSRLDRLEQLIEKIVTLQGAQK